MKVLICDDDTSTVNVLKNQIPWKDLGVDTIFTAYHGNAAIDICLTEKPELVICDVEMPYANGIDVLHRIHEHRIFCAFTFLSAHENFSYAQEAIHFGAFDYITKPFTIPDVISVVKDMITYVNNRIERNNHIGTDDDAKTRRGETDEINSMFRSIRDGFWRNNKEGVRNAVKHRKLHINIDDPYYVVTVIGNVGNKEEEKWNLQTLRYGFRYLAQEAIADRLDWRCMVFDPDSQFEVLQIFICENNLTLEALKKRCTSFIRACNQNMQVSPICYIGGPIPFWKLEEADELKRRAEKLRLRKGQVIVAGEEKEEGSVSSYSAEKVLELIKNTDKNGFMQLIGQLTSPIAMGVSGSDQMIAELHHDLLQTFYQYLSDNGLQAHSLFENDIMREMDRNAERSVFDFISFCSYLFDSAVKQVTTGSDNDISTVNRAKRYIEEHYKEDISRDEIAQFAYVTPNYLSKRFHEQTGMSLREYINRLRVEEAKRLLLSTNNPISTIALDMGFGNISYFSTVFRKITGLSPNEYRDGSNSSEGGLNE